LNPKGQIIWGSIMAEKIVIRAGGKIFEGEFNDGVTSREVLEEGELAYWPPGQAFCIFFGATPASVGDEIRAASAVNIVGSIKGDLSDLQDVPDGAEVSIEKN